MAATRELEQAGYSVDQMAGQWAIHWAERLAVQWVSKKVQQLAVN